ncbi:MAG: type II toxin-antitoxin system RelE/ParE family toxin [Gammaproteobacteria bacterium]|nr:type II toxin-antitoxin system RelE/ParE family toxin [Gammaproteobacteria bacterium]
MTIKYQIRSAAQSDLESIWLYTYEQWGVQQADAYIESLIERFSWLAENPLLGKARNDIKQGYFCFPQGMHLVFYIQKSKHIEIIGVPHKSMDIINYLT